MKRISDYETYRESPFTIEGILERVTIAEDPEALQISYKIDQETGEVEAFKKLSRAEVKLIDTAKYKKIYDSAIPEIMNFSTPALKVFGFILMNLSKGQEEISLDAGISKEDIGYKSRIPVYQGIAELIEKKFICRKAGIAPTYFINANKFYNGDRRNSLQFKR